MELYGAPWWNAAAAAAAVASAGLSALSAFLTARHSKATRQIADIQAVNTFLKDVNAIERDFFDTSRPAETKLADFYSLLNVFEIYAAAWNENALPDLSRMFIWEKIRDAIALIETEPFWLGKLNEARTSETTFAHLDAFLKRNRHDIDAVKRRL